MRPHVSPDVAAAVPSAVPAPPEAAPSTRSQAVVLLQLYALALLILPSDLVLSVVGAQGYVAALIGMFLFLCYVLMTSTGIHNSLQHRNPVRLAVAGLWIVSLVSYILLHRSEVPPDQLLAADRWFMQLASITGVILVATEFLPTLADIKRVIRASVWGGAVCGIVAATQYWLSVDLSTYIRMVPGLAINVDNAAIAFRGGLNRVAGTAIHPIELGVVAAMLLPLALYLLVYDRERRWRWRWPPVVLIGLAIPASVSRSAILGVTLSLILLLVLLPPVARLGGLAIAPFALAAVFVAAPGIIGTLASFFAAGSSDPSIATRLNDYPFVEDRVREAPWFGQGGGTFIAEDAFQILDNQYLQMAVELGLLGVLALAVYMTLPLVMALAARARSDDPDFRMLCSALAGSVLAAAACSVTFDSLAFPMFTGFHALVVGLVGGCLQLTRRRRDAPSHDRGRST